MPMTMEEAWAPATYIQVSNMFAMAIKLLNQPGGGTGGEEIYV